MLLSLAYVSRSAVPAYSDAMIALARTRLRRNAEAGITGALYFDGDAFFQIIEGEAAALDRLFAAILRDGRHFDVRVVDLREIARRRFEGWAMKFVDGAAAPALRRDFAYERLAHARGGALWRRAALLAGA